MTEEQKKRLYAEILCYADMKGYKPAWAATKYKERFGRFPPWSWKAWADSLGELALPTPATYRLLKAQQIAAD